MNSDFSAQTGVTTGAGMVTCPSAYEVVVAGAGPAGVAAAIAAAANGARTLLVESAGTVGGDAITGLPILGACNSHGERVVGGVLAGIDEMVATRDDREVCSARNAADPLVCGVLEG